jgi:hypothetical protein
MERREVRIKFWYGNIKEEDGLEDIFLDGIILKLRT